MQPVSTLRYLGEAMKHAIPLLLLCALSLALPPALLHAEVDVAATLRQASLLRQRGVYQQAVDLCAQALAEKPDDADLLTARGGAKRVYRPDHGLFYGLFAGARPERTLSEFVFA